MPWTFVLQQPETHGRHLQIGSLTALTEWEHVEATQSHSAVYATPEEFERRNLQYSITVAGQAAVIGVSEALATLSRSVSLQPAVLDAIAEALNELHRHLTAASIDSGRVYTGLMEAENHHRLLIDNVRQFTTELQRLVGDRATEEDVFFEVKQQTIGYLQEYVNGIEAPLARLAHGIDRLNELTTTAGPPSSGARGSLCWTSCSSASTSPTEICCSPCSPTGISMPFSPATTSGAPTSRSEGSPSTIYIAERSTSR